MLFFTKPLSIPRASALSMRKITPNSITSFDNQQPINKTKHFSENFNNKNQVPRTETLPYLCNSLIFKGKFFVSLENNRA